MLGKKSINSSINYLIISLILMLLLVAVVSVAVAVIAVVVVVVVALVVVIVVVVTSTFRLPTISLFLVSLQRSEETSQRLL